MRLALDVLITGFIVSVVLTLAVVSVAAHAQAITVATAATLRPPGVDWAGVFILGVTGALLAALFVAARQQPPVPRPVPAEEALRHRVRMAGWVC